MISALMFALALILTLAAAGRFFGLSNLPDEGLLVIGLLILFVYPVATLCYWLYGRSDVLAISAHIERSLRPRSQVIT